MPRTKRGSGEAEKFNIILSPRFQRMFTLIAEHYKAISPKFDQRSVYYNGKPNKSTIVHIALHDWLIGLQHGEKATAEILHGEIEEYSVAAAMNEHSSLSQLFFMPEEVERYSKLVELLGRDRRSFVHGHFPKSMIICIALARYVRVRCGRRIGLCNDLEA